MDLPINYDSASREQKSAAREEYIRRQDYKCCECNESLNNDPAVYVRNSWINWDLFPPNFLKYPVHLHHCHKTGMTIGAVHARCNAYLWQYKGE